jgi:hypothetical protein
MSLLFFNESPFSDDEQTDLLSSPLLVPLNFEEVNLFTSTTLFFFSVWLEAFELMISND